MDHPLRRPRHPGPVERRGRLLDPAKADTIVSRRIEDPGKRAEAEARLLGKGFQSYGAWDPAERSRALDLLGFAGQLVFSTFAPHQFLSSTDVEVFWGGIGPTTGPWSTSAPTTTGSSLSATCP